MVVQHERHATGLNAKGKLGMNVYSLALFVHVSSAICLCIGFGIWFLGITRIARAGQVEQVQTLADLLLMVRLVVPASALLVIITGLTMTQIAWGLRTGWIAVALGSLVSIGSAGTWVIDPKLRTIAALAHTLPGGPLPAALAQRTHDTILHLGLHTLIALLFGIVFLMTTKPVFMSAIVAMVAAAFLGFASGVLFVRARRPAQGDHCISTRRTPYENPRAAVARGAKR